MNSQSSHVALAYEQLTYNGLPEQPDTSETNNLFNDDLYDRNERHAFHSESGLCHSNSHPSAFEIQDANQSRAATNQDLASLAWNGPGLGTYIGGHDPNLFPLNTGEIFDESITQIWPYPTTLEDSIAFSKEHNELGLKSLDEPFTVATWIQPAVDSLQLLENPGHDGNISQQPTTTLALKSKRTRISKAAKKVLDEHFSSNPYPDEKETTYLEKATELSSRIIKTWFSNTRSRRKVVAPSSTQDILRTFDHEIQASLRCASPTHSICRASLEALDKHSSIASMSSLQRYIETPAAQEAIPMEAVDAIVRQYAETADLHQMSGTTLNEQFNPVTTQMASSQRSLSVAGSKSSRGSGNSHTTQNSFKSRDSRGSRRGRKLWVRAKKLVDEDATKLPSPSRLPFTLDDTHSDAPEHLISKNGSLSLLPHFCTVPSCYASFKYRYDWARHEEALHYEPYHWICCRPYVDTRPIQKCFVCHEQNTSVGHIMTEHLESCMYKPRAEVKFLREDQFFQHIVGVHAQEHATQAGCRDFLSLCKIDNADIQSSALHCGFCGETFNTWAERQDHVAKHLKMGLCKSAWWPGRLPLPSAVRTWIGGCNNCSLMPQGYSVNPYDHPTCVAWSCRYLSDHHNIFDTRLTKRNTTVQNAMTSKSVCKLCKIEICSTVDDSDYKDYRTRIQQHANTHHLRSCRQERFSSQHAFFSHLRAEHDALWDPSFFCMLDPWKCQQKLQYVDDKTVVRTFQAFQPSHVCCSKVSVVDNELSHVRILSWDWTDVH